MDMPNIMGLCNYGSKIKLDTADAYKNNELIQAVEYSADDSDVCLGLQTSYNLFSGVESSGSSFKYTMQAPMNGGSHAYINKHEFFGIEDSISKLDPFYFYIVSIVFVITCMVYLKQHYFNFYNATLW